MNKAFVKEDSASNPNFPLSVLEMDAALDKELFTSTGSTIPKNYITPQGFAHLHQSLQKLLQEERPQFAETVSESPNDEPDSESYQDMKARMDEIERKIRLLQRRLDLAEIIDPKSQSGDQVLFGATVTVLDENEKTRVYRIVGIDETDVKIGKVSWVSPIGRALLQAQVGDVVVLETPHGEEELEILKIEYKSIP